MSNIWKLNTMEEVAWRQKPRMLWLKEGVKNTRFFHNMENARRRIKHIRNLRRGGKVLKRKEDVKEEIVAIFENLYRREDILLPQLDGVSFPSISTKDYSWLEREFEVEEVESALSKCGSDKSPSPDDFNLSFIKAGWGFLKNDFIDMIKEFHRRGRLSKEINSTFLTLILEVPNSMKLQEYRPISWWDVFTNYYRRCFVRVWW